MGNVIYTGDLLDTYLAGVFDGEGTVCYFLGGPVERNPRGQCHLRVSVMMTSREVVQMFAARFGGNVQTVPRAAPRREAYSWTRAGHAAAEALGVFRDRCVLKAPMANLALEALTLTIPRMSKREFSKRLSPENWSRRLEIMQEISGRNL